MWEALGEAAIATAGKSAKRVVNMGLAMQRVVAEKAAEHGVDIGIRIGIHTGSVMGGIIGTVKFHFDSAPSLARAHATHTIPTFVRRTTALF